MTILIYIRVLPFSIIDFIVCDMSLANVLTCVAAYRQLFEKDLAVHNLFDELKAITFLFSQNRKYVLTF